MQIHIHEYIKCHPLYIIYIVCMCINTGTRGHPSSARRRSSMLASFGLSPGMLQCSASNPHPSTPVLTWHARLRYPCTDLAFGLTPSTGSSFSVQS